MPSEESSDPIRLGAPSGPPWALSLCSGDSTADMLSITESLTEDSESLADRVLLNDSKISCRSDCDSVTLTEADPSRCGLAWAAASGAG